MERNWQRLDRPNRTGGWKETGRGTPRGQSSTRGRQKGKSAIKGTQKRKAVSHSASHHRSWTTKVAKRNIFWIKLQRLTVYRTVLIHTLMNLICFTHALLKLCMTKCNGLNTDQCLYSRMETQLNFLSLAQAVNTSI